MKSEELKDIEYQGKELSYEDQAFWKVRIWNSNNQVSDWRNAGPVGAPSPEISAQMTEPMRITETIKPVKVTNPAEGVYIFDMEQYIVGWTELRIEAFKRCYGRFFNEEEIHKKTAGIRNYYPNKGDYDLANIRD